MNVEPPHGAIRGESIHPPWRAAVADCVARWRRPVPADRATSYLVVEGDEPGLRLTLGAGRITDPSARLADRRNGRADHDPGATRTT